MYRNEIFQIKTHLQKLKDSFEKKDTYMECYGQYIHHFKSGFPYVSAQNPNEEERNMGTTNDTSDQARKQRGETEVFPELSRKLEKNAWIFEKTMP